jgi:uncharacterized protein YigE (DUF2233 family)
MYSSTDNLGSVLSTQSSVLDEQRSGTPTSLSILLLFLLILLARPASAITYRNLADGLEYGNYQGKNGDPIKLHLFRVDLHKLKVKILDARELQAKVLSVKSMAEQTQALAAINANFFDENLKPLGLIVEEGKLKNPPHPSSWYAALLIKGTQARIAKDVDRETAKGFDIVIQAGPRLVIAGSVPKLKAESSPKSAIGIDSQGRLVFIVSEGSAEINEMAKILAGSEKNGGVGLLNALNLDGGSSTQFFAKVGDFTLWLPGLNQVPIALGIFKK